MIIGKAVLCTFIAAVVTARPADRENEIVGVDVDRTVGQVQAILERNKDLPRLTRTQIVALLEDITSEDAKSLSKSVESLSKSVESSSVEVKPLLGANKQATVINKHTTPAINKDFLTTTPSSHLYNINSIDTGSASSLLQEVKIQAGTPSNSGQVMVVLPYTLDGTTLDELYTRPPRVTVIPAYTLIPQSSSQVKEKSRNVVKDEKEDITVIPLNPSSAPSYTVSKILTNDDKVSSVASNVTLRDEKVSVTKETASVSDAAHNSTVYPDISEDLRVFFNNHGLVSNPDSVNSDVLSSFKPLPSAQTEYSDIDSPEKYLLSYDFSRELGIADPSKINEDISSERMIFPYDYGHAKGEEMYELDALSSDMKATLMQIGLSPEELPDIAAAASKDSKILEVIPLGNGPDPLSLSEPDNVTNELFKRQNSNETSSSESSSNKSDQSSSGSETSGAPVPAVTATTTTTEQPRNPSLSDLADSFGGPANVDPSESELPPPKKNGFYFSLDWNSFLEVGDGDSKVNIRFEPKLGDPQMFLPVSVP